jgi:hypothetical protein
MITYNQAFDLYHTIFRLLHFLNRFDDTQQIEVERIRIWDFYLLFPDKVHEIRLKRVESDIKRLLKTYIHDTANPYDRIQENRKVFEKIKPYQLAALNCIASYGIIEKATLTQQVIVVTNKSIISDFIEQPTNLSPKEQNIISIMTSHFNQVPLFGTDGLKNRTDLMESRYDA